MALQLALAALMLLALEGVRRLSGFAPGPGPQDPYVRFAAVQQLFVPGESEQGGLLVTAPGRRQHFNLQSFAAQKAPGSLRIFCLGDSTTYGQPYTDSSSFAGWLRMLLPGLLDGRPVEVINAGGSGYASYRVAVILDELLDYEPDLFVIYTGHNEFLEARTYGQLLESSPAPLSVGALASRTALFGALRALLGDGLANPDSSRPDTPLLPTEVATLLDGAAGPSAYQRDDAGRAAVLVHFRQSLTRMLARAAARGVPVVLVSPASRLVDCLPFKSQHGESIDAQTATAIDEMLASVDLSAPDAVARLQSALETDPRHALTAYRLGEALLAAGETDSARAAFVRARDEDIVPLRASSDVLAIVRDVAAEQRVPLLDWVTRVDELSRLDGAPLPGRELFLDHVDMTVEASRDLALQLMLLFAQQGWVDRSAPTATELADLTTAVLGSLDRADHVRALVRLANVLDWAGKRQEAERLTEQALQLSEGGDATALFLAGNQRRERGDSEGAVAAWQRAIQIDQSYLEAHFNLASLLRDSGRVSEARKHFEACLQLDALHGPSHLGLGLVLESLGDHSAARNAFRRAIKSQPDLVDAHNRLAISYVSDREYDKAEAALQDAVRVAPGSARARHNLGVLLAELGRVEDAVLELQQAVALESGRASSHHKLGMALVIVGRGDEGLAQLQLAASLAPDDRRIAQDLEQARIRTGFSR